MAPTTHREIEAKLRIDDWFVMPDLLPDPELVAIDRKPPFELAATYFDTDDLVLFRWGITLRRREGGSDAGWHAKVPVEGADRRVRDEIRMPLGPQLPPALADVLSPLVRGRTLHAVATVRTVRTPLVAVGADGAPLIELVSDAVTSTDSAGRSVQYREIEVECLSPEAEAAMQRIVERLLAAGATPSSVSKAAEALGARTRIAPEIRPIPAPGPDGLAVDAIRSSIGSSTRNILFADMGVRRELPDAVHQMRVSIRRLRSLLQTLAPLLDGAWADGIGEELRWIARELAPLRDCEVLTEHLQIDSGSDRAAMQVAADRVAAIMQGARAGAIAALRSDRYRLLLDDLVQASGDPPVTQSAFLPCHEVLPPLLLRQWTGLRRTVKELGPGSSADDWHRTRAKAKRVRYAAAALAPSVGPEADRLARRLEAVTTALGDVQDAEVAIDLLREGAVAQPEHGFELGLAASQQVQRRNRGREAFWRAWPDAKRAARRFQERM